MRKKSNRLSAILLCLLCVFALLPTQAFAAGVIDLSKNVDLTISYQHNGSAITGVPFELYRVADVDAYCEFTLSGDFEGYPVLVNNLSSAEWKTLAETLKGYVDRDQLKPFDQGRTNASGILHFPNQKSEMKPGLYLVIGRVYTSGSYTYTTEPFLVALPSLDEEANVWSYSVNTTPKHTREDIPPTPSDKTVDRKVLKVWKSESSEAQRPQEVIVQLLKNGAVYDTVTLSADNNWRYAWNDLPEYENGHLIDWSVVEKETKGYTVTVTQEGITFVVTNTADTDIPDHPTPVNPGEPTKPDNPKLPQTGMLWWPVPILLVCGMVFLIVGKMMKKKCDE